MASQDTSIASLSSILKTDSENSIAPDIATVELINKVQQEINNYKNVDKQ